MKEYVPDTLFVHTKDTAHLLKRLNNHPCETVITPVLFDDLMANPEQILGGVEHVVVSGPIEIIKAVLQLSVQACFSLGIIPTYTQKKLAVIYDFPRDIDAGIDLALDASPLTMDMVTCNGHPVLFKATIGHMPLLDAVADTGKLSIMWTALRQMFQIELIKYRFKTAGSKQIITAASGCMILHHHKGSLAARVIAGDGSLSDGSISAVISAPISILKYMQFLLRLLSRTGNTKRLPSALGYLKSPFIEIEPETELDVFIDGEKETRTPLRCEIKQGALRVNVGPTIRKDAESVKSMAEERVEIDHLPQGKRTDKGLEKGENTVFFLCLGGAFS